MFIFGMFFTDDNQACLGWGDHETAGGVKKVQQYDGQ